MKRYHCKPEMSKHNSRVGNIAIIGAMHSVREDVVAVKMTPEPGRLPFNLLSDLMWSIVDGLGMPVMFYLNPLPGHGDGHLAGDILPPHPIQHFKLAVVSTTGKD